MQEQWTDAAQTLGTDAALRDAARVTVSAWLAAVTDSALERGAKFPATIDHRDTQLPCIFEL